MSGMRSRNSEKVAAPACLSSFELMAVHRFRHSLPRFVLGEPFFIVVFGYVGDVHPSVCHLVDRALAPADPLVRVGIVWVGGGVVMPGGNADHRSLWENRRRVFRINVIIHPVEG